MQYISRVIDDARLFGYVPDNSEEILPDRTRTTVLVIPGGGYEMTSDRESEPIALQFLAADCNAFALRYSCRPATYPTQLLQVAAALTEIRVHADEWHVDLDRIAVIGFSAGGHLAADFATGASDEVLRANGYDPDELRPQALMLGYPVITAGEFRHDGSFRALLGEDYGKQEKMDEVSVEQHIDARTPPVFVWHTVPDDCVPVENTLMLVEACHKAGVPVEAHLFPSGGHGLALGTAQTAWQGTNGIEPCVQVWMKLALDWLARLFG